jgi:hypothetical protein
VLQLEIEDDRLMPAFACATYEEQLRLADWIDRDPHRVAALETLAGASLDLRAPVPDGRVRTRPSE